MKLTFCSKEIVLHEVTGYPSCLIKVYPYENVFTTYWSHRKNTTQHVVNVGTDIDSAIEKYAFSHECTTEIVALHFEIDQYGPSRLRGEVYRIYLRDQQGSINWSEIGPGFPNLEGASKAKLSFQSMYPESRIVVVKVSTIATVLED